MADHIIEGSSKLFYRAANERYLMTFKDSVHGAERESEIKTTGYLRREFTYYFYLLLEKSGIATHQISLAKDGIFVTPCKPIKIEVLVRNVARGHWVDPHKIPLFEGGVHFQKPIVELCLKERLTLDDGRVLDDPRISEDLAIELNTLAKDSRFRGAMLENKQEAEEIRATALKINKIYGNFLEKQGFMLEDFKFEVGRGLLDNKIIIIDEISPDCSRIRDAYGRSLTKDLFRQKRPEQEIVTGYSRLRDAIREEVINAHS